jgi:flagellum-specific peptidoglycan hydrolase FlgJ
MATSTDKPKSTELNLGPTLAEKTSNATDLNLGTLTMADVNKAKDQKPSTELNLGTLTMADVNQPKDQKPSTELNLGNQKASDLNNPKQKQDEPIIFQTKVGNKIPDALNDIMLLSTEVHNDSINIDSSDPNNPKTYIPRIQSSVIEDPKTKERTVVYHIGKFAKLMKPVDEEAQSGKSVEGSSSLRGSGAMGIDPNGPSANTGTGNPGSIGSSRDSSVLPDILEYDYIYTGKNVDVLQFDMSVKLGYNALTQIQVNHPEPNNSNQTISPENSALSQPDPNEEAGGASKVTTSRLRGTDTSSTPSGSPIGPTVVDPFRIGSGSLSPETLFAARKNVSDQISIALSNQVSVLKIVGNPLLLAGYTVPSDMLGSGAEEPTSESVANAQKEHEAKTGGKTGMTPTVKVNVRSPKPSYMQGDTQGEDDNYYSSPFWININNFRIDKITSKFTRGEFVQFLDLYSLAEQSNTDYHSSDPNSPAAEGGGEGGGGSGTTSPSDYGPNVKNNGSGVKPGYQKDFMDKNWNAANKAADELGTDPKILLAQSAQEVGWGKRTIKDKDGTDSNNMFNIKADKSWHGPTVTKRALEYKNGKPYYSDQKFRAYGSPEESFSDYANFLKTNPRYNSITKTPTKDASQYFGRLKQAGYATAPNYASALTGIYNGKSIKNYKPE